MARYIFITGGVVSSLGKGLASAALGALLQARGYSVRLRKLDPYLNVDPGTMSPYQHGEVVGEIMPETPNYFSILAEAAEDRVGFMIAVLELQTRMVRAA